MLWSSRRAFLVLLTVGALALVSCLPQALAEKILLRKDIIALPIQPVQPGQPTPPVMDPDFSDNISLPKDNLH
jgi:hypothetical protein